MRSEGPVVAKQNYGEGSIWQRHAKDCERPVNRKGESTCDCRWYAALEAGMTSTFGRRRVTVSAKTKPLLRIKLRDKKAEIAKAGTAVASDQRKTVGGWMKEWLEMRERTVRPKTHENDLAACRNYITSISQVRLVDVTPKHLRDVASKARREGGPSMAIATHRILVKMLRDAVTEGYTVQPSVFIAAVPGKAKGRPKPKRDALETAEAIAILAHAADLPRGSRWYVGLFEGIRQGEALGLTWDAIDFDNHRMNIEWQLQALPYKIPRDRQSGFRVPDDFEARHLQGRFHLVRPKTASGERWIPLVPTVEKALKKWKAEAPENPHGLVWAREDGWPIDKHDDADEWRALQEAAGVKHATGRMYVGHEMRNTTATLLFELRVDEVIIVALLGHASIVTSRGYARGRQPAMLAALQQVEHAFTAAEIEG